MRVLLANFETTISDQIQIGLDAFPDVQVETADGVAALDRVRSQQCDCLFVSIARPDDPGEELWENVRESMEDLAVVIVAPEQLLKRYRSSRLQGCFVSFLRQPLEAVDLFRTMNRMFEKVT